MMRLFLIFILATSLLEAQPFTKLYKLKGSATAPALASESALEVMPMQDGGYLLAGRVPKVGSGGFHPYLLKINGQGDSVWSKIYTHWNSARVFTLYKNPQGEMQLGLSVSNPGRKESGVLVTVDTLNGDTLSTKGLPKHSQCTDDGTFIDLLHLPDGTMYISYRDNAAGTGSQDDVGHLYKINSSGRPTWEYGNDGTPNSYQVFFDLHIQGSSITGTGQEVAATNNYIGEWVTTQLDTAGTLQWTTTLHAPPTGWGYRWTTLGMAVTETSSGNYLVGGSFKFDNRLLPQEGTVVLLSGNGDSLNTTRILHSRGVSDFHRLPGGSSGNAVIAGGTGLYVDSSGPSTDYYEKAMVATIAPGVSGNMLVGKVLIGDTNKPAAASFGVASYRGQAIAPAGAGSYIVVGSGFRSQNGNDKVVSLAAKVQAPSISQPEFDYKEDAARAYPNPAQSFVRLEWPGNKKQTVKLYNAQGQILLHRENVASGQKLNLKNIRPGMYFLTLGAQQKALKIKVL